MKVLIEYLERLTEIGGIKKDITLLILSGIALILSIFRPVSLPFDWAWIAIALCGAPILLEAFIGMVTSFDIKADLLVSLALIASVCIGEYFAAGEVAFIMQIGGLLEKLTVAKARAGIEKLVKLTPRTARITDGGSEKIVPAEQVPVGARVRVLPGETVPVDGVIVFGETTIDQAVMTGEPLPVDKGVGDEVCSGTVNRYGAFEMRATKVGEDSSIQRMIRLVQTADAGKAKIVRLADRWATWIVVFALASAAVTWLVSGQILRAVTILVVFCPCALVLATPTAIMAAIGNAAKHGFLVREGDALERLASVTKICFDKTGTLTRGTPKVAAVKSIDPSFTDADIYRLAAIAERNSEHPLGKAVCDSYARDTGRNADLPDSFTMLPGRGVIVTLKGKQIAAGSRALTLERGADPAAFDAAAKPWLDEGCTVIGIRADGVPVGMLALSDTPRDGIAETMARVVSAGVCPVLLTGDNRGAANAIAKRVNITEVAAECLPEDKLRYIRASQDAGGAVCMVGDGINDAPALKTARVGIAMGGTGSDIAVDAADIVLADDRIGELPHLLALSRRMMRAIRLNMTFSMTLNFIAIALAITGVLDPVAGALVHNAGSVLVITSSALLLNWKERGK